MSRKSIFIQIHKELAKGELTLPSLPQVSLQIKKAAANPNVDLQQLTKVAEIDPPFCGYLLQLSNSPVYRGAVDIEKVNLAIGRLGLQNTCNIAMTYAIRGLFHKNKASINHWLERIWQNSSYTAAVACVIAEHIKHHTFDPDEALLAGLLQDIGCLPLIEKAAPYPELINEEKAMQFLFDRYAPSVGATILRKWGLSEKFIEVVINRDNWKYNPPSGVSLTDLVLIAKLHTYLLNKSSQAIPRINQTPAFIKLQLQTELSPESSLQFVFEAKQKIAQTKRALGG